MLGRNTAGGPPGLGCRLTSHPEPRTIANDVAQPHLIAADSSIHPTAVVDEPVQIGAAVKIWHFCHISENAKIGEGSSLGQNVFVAPSVEIGRGVKIQNNVSVYAGVRIEDEVFVGPSVVFTNIRTPRAFIDRREEFAPTTIRRRASLGANATILCGVTIGEGALIGAGAVVTQDVPAYGQVVGNPARQVGWVDEEGRASQHRPAAPSFSSDAGDAAGPPQRICLLDPSSENASIQSELEETALSLLRSGRFILGETVEKFENECAEFLGAKYAVGVSSGSDAVLVALMAAGVGRGDEVLTTPFSFVAGVEAILRLGAIPRFVDLGRGSFLLERHAVLAAVTNKTKAFLPVHLFGEALDLSALRPELAERGVTIIEDAAQAFGAEGREGRVGHLAAATCFSFFPSKNLGGFGDGGLVSTDDLAWAERLRRLRAHGAASKYHHSEVGGNFRLDALQAALLSVKLKTLPSLLERRKANARRYQERLTALGVSEQRLTFPKWSTPGHSYNQFVIESDRRDDLKAHLAAKGIDSAIYYPEGLHLQPLLKEDQAAPGSFPRTERACRRVLALPCHPALQIDLVDRVCGEIERFFRDAAL